MMKLLEFNFKIQYKKGSENKVADALSRLLPKCFALSAVTLVWAEDLLLSYQQDPVSKKLLEQLLLQQPDPNAEYTIHAGIIRYKGKILVGNNADLKTKLIQALHSSPIRGQS